MEVVEKSTEETTPAEVVPFPVPSIPLLNSISLPRIVATVDVVARRLPWWVWLGGGLLLMHFWGKRSKSTS